MKAKYNTKFGNKINETLKLIQFQNTTERNLDDGKKLTSKLQTLAVTSLWAFLFFQSYNRMYIIYRKYIIQNIIKEWKLL